MTHRTRDVWVLDRDSLREVDRAAIEDFEIPGIVLMENASRGLCEQALRMLGDANDTPPTVLIICGSGNNGGDGWAVARHLHNHEMNVVIAPLRDPKPEGDAGINAAICRMMGLREVATDHLDRWAGADLIIDAIFGTGLDREVKGRAAEIIEWINFTGRPVLAVDAPSGLDCNTGKPLGPTVKAACTVTFVAWKPGFLIDGAKEFTGEIVVAGIGAPRELVERAGKIVTIPANM